MKIFITGATGFIGANLAGELLKEGHELHVIRRRQAGIPGLADNPAIRFFDGDLLDTKSLMRAMQGCEQVYHLAAYAKNWAKDATQYEQVNLTGTQNVLEAALASGVKKVVYTSTAGTLGPSNGHPMDEAQPRLKGFFNDYERTKFLAEEAVKTYIAKGLWAVTVNPPRVFGPGLMSESNAATKIIKWYTEGKWRIILGDGQKLGNYSFVQDVVRGHQLAMKNGKPGERYILGGTNLSLKEYLNLIGEVSGRQYKLFSIPLSVAMRFAQLEAFRAAHTSHYPLITPSWIEKYKYDWALTSQKAQQELGYQITPIREALDATIRALRN